MMTPEDHQLSMRVSPRARNETANLGLRAMLVHRLRPTRKAVWRWALRADTSSVFCEPCLKWVPVNEEPEPFWTCPECGRLYEVEMVIFSEVQRSGSSSDEVPATPV